MKNLEDSLDSTKFLCPFYEWSEKEKQWTSCENDKGYQYSWKGQLTTLTFNVLYDKKNEDNKEQKPNVIYSEERYDKIIQKVGQKKPTLITFNEVTTGFIRKLENSQWVRKEYFISEISKIKQNDKCFGNMIISRIKPEAVHRLKVLSNERNVIIAFYKLPNKKLFSLTSLHLSAFSFRYQTRAQQLKEIINHLKLLKNVTTFHLLQGDYNFIHQTEEQLIKKYQMKDLWTEIHDLKENPGYTFDSGKNLMINQIYWGFNKYRSRLDRILSISFEQQEPFSFDSIELCFNKPLYCEEKNTQYMGKIKGITSMFFDMFSVNAFRNKEEYLFLSDHFGIQAKFKLK